jgi:hypothetical protein
MQLISIHSSSQMTHDLQSNPEIILLTQLFAEINIELTKIAEWYRANKIAVNILKTKYIIFCTRGKLIYK